MPFGMAKVGLYIEGYAPAGYVSESTEPTRGVSPLHDTGTGSSSGSYGNFCIMPVLCNDDDLDLCPTLIEPRHQNRSHEVEDVGRPGYFSSQLDNGIKIELTSTRRATLERYSFPVDRLKEQRSSPHLVLDWTNDSPGTFRGGEMTADWKRGRIVMNGTWESSFGPGQPVYQAFQCVDIIPPNSKQTLGKTAIFGGDRYGMDTKREDITHWSRLAQAYGDPIQAGALVAFDTSDSFENYQRVLIRRGISFKSAEKACANMEEEIPDWDFSAVSAASAGLWEDKLKRIELDPGSDDTVKRLFYTSFYRTFLSPNNATEDGPFETDSPYFDGLYCSWDTFRTLFPFMALSSPHDFAQIAETYIDGWRKEGWLPECRANQVKGFIQGGNNGVPILADFAVKYGKWSDQLGVNLKDLYASMKHDIEEPSPQFQIQGRQAEPFNKYGFVPFAYLDPFSAGIQTRETSRSLEYSFGDFTAAMTAAALGGPEDDIAKFTESALNYRKNFDPNASSDGFHTFVQKRFANGTFFPTDPIACSPQDTKNDRSCSLQQQNVVGTYESSPWEYSFYAPHDGAGLVELLGGAQTFEKRLDHFFEKGYYLPGNEPSFDTPSLYHHIGKPYKSIRRVRQVVAENFKLSKDGVPGNDDNGAMASLLSWYLLGFYPVPGTKEMLILSPFVPGYTIHNTLLGDVTVTVTNFDSRSINSPKGLIDSGVRAFVKSVKINGTLHVSRCRISFDDFFPSKGAATTIEIELTDEEIDSCGGGEGAMPASLSKGGFLTQ